MAAPLPSKILLFGATGLIGQYIIASLVEARSSFQKIGIFTSPGTVSRKADEIAKLKAKGVEVIVGNVENENDVKKAYEGYDTVISALGRRVIPAQIPMLRLAEASPTIRHFYPSEYGTDIEYGPQSRTERPHQVKLKVRAYVRDNIRKLKVTYLVTGPFSDLYIDKMRYDEVAKAGTFDVKARKAVLPGTGKEKVSFTTMRDVGRLLVAALKTPVDKSPRALKVNSFTASAGEILKHFERQTGAKWQVEYTSMDELKKMEKAAVDSGSPFATFFTLKRIWTEGGTLYRERDNGKVGNPPLETLEEQVRRTIAKQMSA